MITIMNTRLKQFIAAENISQSQFADTIKVVRASVSHVLSGRNNPGYEFIRAIMTAYPNLNMEWLILGKGRMYKDMSSEGNLFHEEPIHNDDQLTLPEAEEFVQDVIIEPENSTEKPTFTIINEPQHVVNQRKVSKVIIFFDDGSYQEM